jgi:WD40 repeat protein
VTGEEIRSFKGNESWIFFVAFGPDGARLLTSSGSSVARLWDAATGEELRVFTGHDDVITSAAFSPDGTRVLTESLDKTVRLWDAATGKELRVFRRLDGPGESVAFSPNGARILSGSSDKTTARLWDVATGQQILSFKGGTAVAFSPDGARVLTGSNDKTARLWDISGIPEGSIFDIACAWLPDYDLSSLGKDYGLDLSGEPPICQKDADGRFATLLPGTSTAKGSLEKRDTPPLHKQLIKLLRLEHRE